MKGKINHKVNAKPTMMKRCLNDIFKLEKLIFVKTPGAHSTLKNSANHKFGACAPHNNSQETNIFEDMLYPIVRKLFCI